MSGDKFSRGSFKIPKAHERLIYTHTQRFELIKPVPEVARAIKRVRKRERRKKRNRCWSPRYGCLQTRPFKIRSGWENEQAGRQADRLE